MRASSSILLVDDHAVVREGYRSLLGKQPHLVVVGEASDGAEAYRQFKSLKPDLVIMDLTMPGFGGIEAIRRIRQWDHTALILVFTMHQSPAYAVQAIRAGAKGYVTKSNRPAALLSAVADILNGRLALSSDMDHCLAVGQLLDEPRAVDVLTPREFEVLQMLLGERTANDIATTLNVSPKTVANTRFIIRSKLGARSEIELVKLALRQGIVPD